MSDTSRIDDIEEGNVIRDADTAENNVLLEAVHEAVLQLREATDKNSVLMEKAVANQNALLVFERAMEERFTKVETTGNRRAGTFYKLWTILGTAVVVLVLVVPAQFIYQRYLVQQTCELRNRTTLAQSALIQKAIDLDDANPAPNSPLYDAEVDFLNSVRPAPCTLF